MTTETLVTFTDEAISTILDNGGTQAWRLGQARACRCAYAVLCRNTHSERTPSKNQAPEFHGAAFLVGRISGVVPSSQEGRWLVVFDEYAELNLPGVWQGSQNPVHYTTLKELEIDADSLDFKPMPKPRQQPMTIERAKQELAATFGVKLDMIEIIIRG